MLQAFLFALGSLPSYIHRPTFGLRLVCNCSGASAHVPKNYFCMQKIKNHPLIIQKPCYEPGCTRPSGTWAVDKVHIERHRSDSKAFWERKESVSAQPLFITCPIVLTTAACLRASLRIAQLDIHILVQSREVKKRPPKFPLRFQKILPAQNYVLNYIFKHEHRQSTFGTGSPKHVFSIQSQ